MRVSTGEMIAHSAGLAGFAETAGAVRARVGALLDAVDPGVMQAFDAPYSAVTAAAAMHDAVAALFAVQAQCEILTLALGRAADGYGLAEHHATAATTQAAAHLAYGLGRIFPLLLTWFTPAALGAAGAWMLSPGQRRRAVTEWLGSNTEALSDPRVVDLVRLVVMSADEFGAGAVQLPHELVALLGEEGMGILGLTTAAGALTVTARGFGLLTETPVKVARTHSHIGVTPPTGFADRARRIPPNASQIRIERYEIAGEPDRFEVYISGTRDGSPVATGQPFDMTSNLTAMAMGDAGSVRAVQMAMAAAGVTAETPVQFTGYSQGAIVAVALAGTGQYDTRGIFTVGGPTGQLPVPEGVPNLALEHEEDIVPALGGTHADLDTVLVRRSLYDGGAVPDTSALPAHDLAAYRESADLLDATAERRVAGVAADMAEFTRGATSVDSTKWLARRA